MGLCETKKEQERKNGRKIKEAGKKGEQESDGRGGGEKNKVRERARGSERKRATQ